jgi:hypothetical protein
MLQLLLVWGLCRGLLRRRKETIRLLAYSTTALAAVMIQAKYIDYHLLILYPFLCSLIGLSMGLPPHRVDVPAQSPRPLPVAARLATTFLVGLALCSCIGNVTEHWRELADPERRRPEKDLECNDVTFHLPKSIRLAKEIERSTTSEDRVFLWSNQPLAYFLSDRRMAGPYAHLFPIVAPWLGEERVHRLVERLEKEQPRLIVTGSHDAIWRKEDSSSLLQVFPEMEDFLKSRYREDRHAEGFTFWIRTE